MVERVGRRRQRSCEGEGSAEKIEESGTRQPSRQVPEGAREGRSDPKSSPDFRAERGVRNWVKHMYVEGKGVGRGEEVPEGGGRG